MKERDGFVANSSSTCWVLDIRTNGVQELVDENRHLHLPMELGLGRESTCGVGRDVTVFARWWVDDMSEWGDVGEHELGNWLLRWALEIGTDNIVFIRSSDEGMGGWLEGNPSSLALDSMEYH